MLLLHLLNSVLATKKKKSINKWIQLCANKTLFTIVSGRNFLTLYEDYYISFSLTLRILLLTNRRGKTTTKLWHVPSLWPLDSFLQLPSQKVLALYKKKSPFPLLLVCLLSMATWPPHTWQLRNSRATSGAHLVLKSGSGYPRFTLLILRNLPMY